MSRSSMPEAVAGEVSARSLTSSLGLEYLKTISN